MLRELQEERADKVCLSLSDVFIFYFIETSIDPFSSRSLLEQNITEAVRHVQKVSACSLGT